MLTNVQVEALAERMGVPLEPVVFKSYMNIMLSNFFFKALDNIFNNL